MQAHSTHTEVLEVLHRQGSALVDLEVLQAHTTLISDHEQDGETYPCVAMANGVRWFYDRDRRPPSAAGPKKALAPDGVPRQLLGELAPDHDPILLEGERDWLTALSVGLKGALCVGGASNLDETQILTLAQNLSTNVVLLFDNDGPGRAAAANVASQLIDAGCRSVKIAQIQLADADFSDWVESLPPDRVLEIVLQFLQGAEKFGKREAKRHQKEEAAKREANKPKEADEFVVGADLITSIWKPGDPSKPHIIDAPGRAKFAHFDAAATKRSNLLVVNELDRWEREEPPDDAPDMYAGQQQAQLRDRPPVLIPMGGETFQKRIMVLPSGAKEHGSSEQLFDELIELIDAYLVIEARFIRAMAAYVMMSYRYKDAGYEAVPYIRTVGPAGTGKTRFLRIMRELCFRTVFVAGMRPVHLYRILSYFSSGVTMIFEEFNLNDAGSDTREFVNMLNAGNQKDTFVPRQGGMQFQDLEWHPLFCPKVLTTTNDFINEGLLRRSITGHLGGLALPPEKSLETLPDVFFQRCAELRAKLLGWRFMKYGQPVNPQATKYRGKVGAGIWQNFFPLVAMVPEARSEAITMLLELATEQASNLDVAQGSRPIIRILESAAFVANGEADRAWTIDILEHVSASDPRGQWTLEIVRRCLRETKLPIKRSAKIIDGHKKFDYYVTRDDEFATCLRRHGLDDSIAAEGERLSDIATAKRIM